MYKINLQFEHLHGYTKLAFDKKFASLKELSEGVNKLIKAAVETNYTLTSLIIDEEVLEEEE